MYNPFTKHPKLNAGMRWFQHLKFAWCIGIRLLISAVAFLVHGVFPFGKIPETFNLTDTALYLLSEEENRGRNCMKLLIKYCPI